MSTPNPPVIIQGRMITTTPGSILSFFKSLIPMSGVTCISFSFPKEQMSMAWDVLFAFARSFVDSGTIEDSSIPKSELGSSPGAAQPHTVQPKPTTFECHNDGVTSEDNSVVINGIVADAASLGCVPQKITNKNLLATGCSMMLNGIIDVPAMGVVRGVQSNTRGQGN